MQNTQAESDIVVRIPNNAECIATVPIKNVPNTTTNAQEKACQKEKHIKNIKISECNNRIVKRALKIAKPPIKSDNFAEIWKAINDLKEKII